MQKKNGREAGWCCKSHVGISPHVAWITHIDHSHNGICKISVHIHSLIFNIPWVYHRATHSDIPLLNRCSTPKPFLPSLQYGSYALLATVFKGAGLEGVLQVSCSIFKEHILSQSLSFPTCPGAIHNSLFVRVSEGLLCRRKTHTPTLGT